VPDGSGTDDPEGFLRRTVSRVRHDQTSVLTKVITTGLAPSRPAAGLIADLSNSLHQLFWGRVRAGVQKRF
jgi:hypothetical protein